MKLHTMEKALGIYPNRFQLTMMAVARAREINDGDSSLVESDDVIKPVEAALVELGENFIVPATHDEMTRIRDAKRIIREKALMAAREKDEQLYGEGLAHSTSGKEDTSEES